MICNTRELCTTWAEVTQFFRHRSIDQSRRAPLARNGRAPRLPRRWASNGAQMGAVAKRVLALRALAQTCSLPFEYSPSYRLIETHWLVCGRPCGRRTCARASGAPLEVLNSIKPVPRLRTNQRAKLKDYCRPASNWRRPSALPPIKSNQLEWVSASRPEAALVAQPLCQLAAALI